MVKEGGTGGAFTTVASNAAAIALGGGWMGYIHQNGNAYTKVGLNDTWTLQWQGGVTFMSLGGSGSDRRIGLIKNNIAIARVGADPWVYPLYTGATKVRVNSGRVAVLTNEGQMKAKEGSLNEVWTPLSSNVTDIQLN